MRLQRTPIDELIGGTCYEVRNYLRGCEEGLTPEAVNHLIEETAYRCIMYEAERHAVSQDNPIFREILFNYDYRLVSLPSHYEGRFEILPNSPPFSTIGGFSRCFGHLMNKVVGGVIGEFREPPREGIEPINVSARTEMVDATILLLSDLPLESAERKLLQDEVAGDDGEREVSRQ